MTGTNQSEAMLIQRVLEGDGASFASLITPIQKKLHGFIQCMVIHPQDAEDILQDVLLQGYQKLGSFRGEASFSSWLFAIASRLSIDHLRVCRRWTARASLEGQMAAHEDEELMDRMARAASTPDFRYDTAEHMAFCFSCVARALPPEQAAAILLREVYEFSALEAAKMLDMTESVFCRHLSAARATMIESFDGLCALAGKQGACNQCRELRDFCPANRRGEAPRVLGMTRDDPAVLFDERLRRVRAADLAGGSANRLHRLMLQFMAGMFN